MASIQCDYPGCTISAKEKCGICGNIYCIRHIQRTGAIDTCDVCIAKKQAERDKATAKKIAETAEALAKLEAERPRREANRKTRVRLAWIGTSMILSSMLLTAFFGSTGIITSIQPQPYPLAWVVIEALF